MELLCAGYLKLQTHSEYVILIASQLQQWLRERASTLRYMYIACLVHVMAVRHTVVTVGWQHQPNGRTSSVVT